MKRFTRRANTEHGVIRRVLNDIEQELQRISDEETRRLRRVMSDHRQLKTTLPSIDTLSFIYQHVVMMQRNALDLRPEEAVGQLEELALNVAQAIAECGHAPHSALARAMLNRVASQIHSAEAQFIPLLQPQKPTPIQSVLVPSDMLFQAHRSLFPPERMLVVAGHRSNAGTIQLGATFDVTGNGPDTHHGHVRADPEKLGRALIDMDLSGTELGAWVHSHPGDGAGATTPSQTDLRQHQDWIRDYNNSLISVILVRDGHIRFWGTALESGQVELQIVGPGVEQEETHVYRLAQG